MNVGAASVLDASVVCDAPKEKTCGAVVVSGTLTGAALTAGPPIFAAPNVNGTADDSSIGFLEVSSVLVPKVKTVGELVVIPVVEATINVLDVEVAESTLVFAGRLKVGTGNPEIALGLTTSAG